jgi:hypothetical protein
VDWIEFFTTFFAVIGVLTTVSVIGMFLMFWRFIRIAEKDKEREFEMNLRKLFGEEGVD